MPPEVPPTAAQPTDADIARILTTVKTIAVVGWSPKPDRPSHRVAQFLAARGYRVLPVNPGAAGQQALGASVVANLADIAEPVDMVDIFRKAEDAGAICDEAIEIGAKSVWLQLKVIDHAAAKRCEDAGLKVVMDRCPAIDMPRLGLGPKNPHKPKNPKL